MKTSMFQLKADKFRELCGPGVYIYSKGKWPLYIGSSKNLISRAFNERHHCHEVLSKSNIVTLVPCANLGQARELESWLIKEHKPVFNKKKGECLPPAKAMDLILLDLFHETNKRLNGTEPIERPEWSTVVPLTARDLDGLQACLALS